MLRAWPLRVVALIAMGFIVTSVILIERAAEHRRRDLARYGWAEAASQTEIDGAQGAVFAQMGQGVLAIEPPAAGSLRVTVFDAAGVGRRAGLRSNLPAGRHLVHIDSGPLFAPLGGRSTLVAVSVVIKPGEVTRLRRLPAR